MHHPHRGELITNYYHIFSKYHSQSCSLETLHATNWQRLQIIQLFSNMNQQSRKQAVILYFSVIDYAWSVAIKNICKRPLKTWSCFWIPLWGRISDGDRWVAVCSMCVKFRILSSDTLGDCWCRWEEMWQTGRWHAAQSRRCPWAQPWVTVENIWEMITPLKSCLRCSRKYLEVSLAVSPL